MKHRFFRRPTELALSLWMSCGILQIVVAISGIFLPKRFIINLLVNDGNFYRASRCLEYPFCHKITWCIFWELPVKKATWMLMTTARLRNDCAPILPACLTAVSVCKALCCCSCKGMKGEVEDRRAAKSSLRGVNTGPIFFKIIRLQNWSAKNKIKSITFLIKKLCCEFVTHKLMKN